MQQTKSYWYVLAAFGVATGFVGAACTVNSTTVDTNAGATGEDTAGTPNAGGGQGGAAAGIGGAGAAGADTTTVPACDPEDGGVPMSTPATSCESGVTDDCSTCVKKFCCAEYSACFGTSPGNVCGYGGPNNEGEFPCYQTCLQKVFADNGSIGEDDRGACASSCITSKDNMGALDCGTLGTTTNDLIACLADDANMCNMACFGG